MVLSVKNESKMEDIILIFPHIAKQVFEKLDNKDLANCRLVVKSWKNFIDQQNLPWTRIVVQKYCGYIGKYFGEFQETPLHLAAKYGQFETFKMLCKDYEDINPMTEHKETPLEYTIKNDHLEFCQFIIANLKDNKIWTEKGGIFLWTAKSKKMYEVISTLRGHSITMWTKLILIIFDPLPPSNGQMWTFH